MTNTYLVRMHFFTVSCQTMPSSSTTFLFLLLLASTHVTLCNNQDLELVHLARAELLKITSSARVMLGTQRLDHESGYIVAAWSDCLKLYEDTEPRLVRLGSGEGRLSREDKVTWLSGALASHRSCLDGLEERGLLFDQNWAHVAQNFSGLIGEALALYRRPDGNLRHKSMGGGQRKRYTTQHAGLLASWDAANSKADLVVAKDGSGNYNSINGAVNALAKMGSNRPDRVVLYVKAGVYEEERVEVGREMKNVMIVGDGMDKTIVTGSRNFVDGATTLNSATFEVSGDGFWARDVTFVNTAGPHKHQAVALKVSSDLAVLYRCSIKGYQDTLYTHSLRQFYRDCHIYGTQDFIFGNAPTVFQNCNIFVRRPMGHQSNMITAQGRENPNENTGISILNSRVMPTPEFQPVKAQFKSYLGRPWKKYSRVVVLKTELDGLIDPKGWEEWRGSYALSTLYYGEYMNSGIGANTDRRVRWSGFHVLVDPKEANPFTVRNFIQGDKWIPLSGVPFSPDI